MTPARPDRPKLGPGRAWRRLPRSLWSRRPASASSSAENRTLLVEVRGIFVQAARLVAHVGETVTWRNGDLVAHTATSKEAGFDVELAPGKEEGAPR